MTKQQAFIAAARELIGARWRHRGRKPWAVDCVGLLILAAQKVDVLVFAPHNYGREPWEDMLRQGLRVNFGDPFPVSEAKPGDVALIRWRQGEPSHIAIVGDHPEGWLSLIHAHNLFGVVEHSLAPPFDKVIVEVYKPWRDTSSR